MKLSKWAKMNDISYQTAWNMFKAGKIENAYQLSTGTILVNDDKKPIEYKTVIYCRVSSSQNKDNLITQSERMINYCNAKGWAVDKVYKEIGSGLNDNRKQLLKILSDKSINRIVVEHKDRFSRFGINYIIKLLELDNRELIIVNNTDNDRDDLMQDFVSIITSFTARLYGQRRSKRKTNKIIKELNDINRETHN